MDGGLHHRALRSHTYECPGHHARKLEVVVRLDVPGMKQDVVYGLEVEALFDLRVGGGNDVQDVHRRSQQHHCPPCGRDQIIGRQGRCQVRSMPRSWESGSQPRHRCLGTAGAQVWPPCLSWYQPYRRGRHGCQWLVRC